MRVVKQLDYGIGDTFVSGAGRGTHEMILMQMETESAIGREGCISD